MTFNSMGEVKFGCNSFENVIVLQYRTQMEVVLKQLSKWKTYARMKQRITIHLDNTFKTLSGIHNLFVFLVVLMLLIFQLLTFSFVHCRNCDNNSFNGILVMDILDENYTFYLPIILISMLYNNINELRPNNGTYSPVL